MPVPFHVSDLLIDDSHLFAVVVSIAIAVVQLPWFHCFFSMHVLFHVIDSLVDDSHLHAVVIAIAIAVV